MTPSENAFWCFASFFMGAALGYAIWQVKHDIESAEMKDKLTRTLWQTWQDDTSRRHYRQQVGQTWKNN